MRLTRRSNLRWLVVIAGPAVVACGQDRAAGATGVRNAVAVVGITLSFPGHVSDAFLTLGDRDTVRAQAYTRGWPSSVKYDSQTEPRRFAYTSSDRRVAAVDADGVVVTAGAGTTLLRATSEGAESPPLALTVAPPARELRAAPATLEAAVGETVTVTVTAVDERGLDVAGVVFNVAPDTTVWAVISPPAEGPWRLETPRVLHIRASRAGSVHLLAYSQNERAVARLQAKPVRITVRGR